MCGIAGIFNKRGVEKMLKAQKHRAPDDEGVFCFENAEVGMGRLKVIDLSSPGLCPYKEDCYTLCYNGEIYNYIELRKKLKKRGWKFRTSSDTEVLMKCWREWGLKMFDRLNGMFAFAIYDARRKRLILARDIAGEKPLYFYSKGDILAFASEAKAFAAVASMQYRDDRFYNAFQHCRGDTLFKNVQEIPPANYLVYDIEKGKHFIKSYWEFKPRTIRMATAEEELEDLLEDAVRIRTRSDVPYGLYYSGGIDSSLISTFHDFKHKFYFDNTKNWKDNFFKSVNKITWHLDFPVGSLSSYPLWKLAERARRKVKVVISGEGADEIFGGYARYLPIAREWELRNKFPSYNSYLFKKYFKFSTYADGFAKITARNEDTEYVRSQLAPFFDMFQDPINAMGFADFKLVLPSLLQMGDRMAGAFGIENRCPFLDKRVIEFGFSLPPEFKISGLEQKVLLRRLLEKRELTEPLLKEKEGLTITFNKWFKKNDWDRSLYFNLLNDRWKKLYLAKKAKNI